MERLRNLGKIINRFVAGSSSEAAKFDKGVSWDSSQPIRFQLPSGLNLEMEKKDIEHGNDCVVDSLLVIKHAFESRLVINGNGWGSAIPASVETERVIQLECVFCKGCSPNILPGFSGTRRFSEKNRLLSWADEQLEKAKQQALSKEEL